MVSLVSFVAKKFCNVLEVLTSTVSLDRDCAEQRSLTRWEDGEIIQLARHIVPASSIERAVSAYVVVQHSQTPANRSARGRRAALTSSRVKRVLDKHDAVVLPSQEPGSDESEGSHLTTIAVPDMERANRLAAELRGIAGIETAYAKPGEELP